MKKKILVLLMSAVIVSSCLAVSGIPPLVLKEVVNNVSDQITARVRLPENPGTGYDWHFTISNPDVIALESKSELQEPGQKLVGQSHYTEWIFRPLKTGSAVIVFKYYRDWEGEETAESIHIYRLETYSDTYSECIPQTSFFLREEINSLIVGQGATVQLEENASTGFSWNLSISNPEVIALVTKKTVDKKTVGNFEISLKPAREENPKGPVIEIIGAPDRIEWEFEALKPGNCILTLQNYRSLEGEGTAEEVHMYNIVVEG